jgi:hypothetical protein
MAQAEMFFVNDKTGKKYKILKFDQAAGKVRLVGEHGIEFEEKYDKETFQKLGYELKQGEATAA